jgi:hypothetical protein
MNCLVNIREFLWNPLAQDKSPVFSLMFLGFSMALSACQTNVRKARADQLGWDELTTVAHLKEYSVSFTAFRQEPLLKAAKGNNSLAQLVVSRGIETPIPYEQGVLGTIGSAKFFITTKDKIQTFSRLYWVMVKVLSEKYGCFILNKWNYKDRVNIRCRDRRRIVLWRKSGPDYIQFYGRQFDKQGYEIEVKKRRIVRISSQKII